MKKCPRCGLLCPEDLSVCECRFDFVNDDPSAVRGTLRRRARVYQVIGAVIVVFGLMGGMSWLPIRFSFFLNLGRYTVDLGMVVAGFVLVLRGWRILERPWTERMR